MRGRRRVPKPPTRMRATFVLAESDQRWARWSRIPFMVIREVYSGYLNVFLAWQDQLLVAGSVFGGRRWWWGRARDASLAVEYKTGGW